MRLLLGMGESISFPSYSRILATQYPEHHRGLANAIVDAGTKTGPAIGTLLGRPADGAIRLARVFRRARRREPAVAHPVVRVMPRGTSVQRREAHADLVGIPRDPQQALGLFSALGLFCSNYFWYFLVTWLPRVSRTRAPLREIEDGGVRIAVLPGDRQLDDGLRLALGSHDPARRESHPRAQGLLAASD